MSNITFDEYEGCVPGCIRAQAPKCPAKAVIPIVTVENKTGLKNLNDCFVHVLDINTTFYIDDKHRMTITWAGPVEVSNYDFDENPLGLRSQMAIDFDANKAYYYNANGACRIISLGD